MKEIHIAEQIIRARHEKKITQEELANYIGVSKAAVSKWESANSYPDITYLPQLATYFDMSIDDLMGYEPQLTREEIKTTYHRLKGYFASEPFDQAVEKCMELEKKYYSCFPFLLQLVILYMNHGMLGENPIELYEHAAGLAQRVRTMSENVDDAKEAAVLEAGIWLMTGQPQRALDLMDERLRPISQDTEILAQVYQGIGNVSRANSTYQIAIYQHLLSLLNDMTAYLALQRDSLKNARESIRRALCIVDAFQVEYLHPNTAAVLYLTAAQVETAHHQGDEAIAMIDKYVNLCTGGFFPVSLRGDSYFDQIDSWFLEFELGNAAPRSEKIIKESMVQGVRDNPAFASLKDDSRYKRAVKKLEEFVEDSI